MKKLFVTILMFASLFGFAQVNLTNTGLIKITSLTDTFYIDGNFTNTNPAILTNDGNLYVKGNITNNQATDLSGTGIIFMNGTANQDVSETSAFKNLTINKIAGTVTLSTNASVNGALNFIRGNIQTGVNKVILSTTGSLTGAAQNTGWVNGKLQKYTSTGAVTKTFEVGDASVFAPASIVFPNITTAGNITVNTTPGEHPNIATSVINVSKDVNRHWRIVNAGAVFSSYKATFNFVAGDIDAGANTSLFSVGLYDGSSWYMPGTSLRNPTNTTKAVFNSFGDFAIGETWVVVPVTFKMVKAFKQSDDVAIEWRVENETNIDYYEVQRLGGVGFSRIATTTANGSALYRILDTSAITGDNFYRIRSVAGNGDEKYSSIVNVNLQKESKIVIYPNPVTGSLAKLKLINLPHGNYKLEMYNASGQLILLRAVQHSGGTSDQTVLLNKLPSGKYVIKLNSSVKYYTTSMIKE